MPFTIFLVIKKTSFEDHFGSQKLQRSSTPVELERPFRDPAFQETIVITVSLGNRGFQQYIFSMEIGSFSVLVAFRCAMFYTTFLSLIFIKHR